MKQPLVTVLMPNHNGGRFIRASIQSVLAQTMKDYEFLIVEDASADQSREIIDSFDDKRIRVIQFEQNEHICVALNTGLKEAKGKYIARIDSDDCWKPAKLEKQIAYMEANPSCGASFTWVDVIDEDDRVLSAAESIFVDLFRVENKTREQWISHFFFKGSCLCHPSAVMRTDVARQLGGYRNTLVQIQDFDLWIRIVKRHDIHVLTEPLMRYRHCLQGGNVSAVNITTQRRTIYEMYRVMGKYFDDLSDEMFIRCFGGCFKMQGAHTHEELLCERALFLLDPIFCGHAAKFSGMEKLADLLDCEDTRVLLREKYGITQMNFYQLSASEALYMPESDEIVFNRYSGKDLIKFALRRRLAKSPRLFWVIQRLRGK
ncbi:MAG: glycosyltransferase family 2 protein [Clostridia bacterium]|nr:glycosyltransferase family 2 protein [Clostridia bacterium]